MTIQQIQLANTFDVWRIATNDLISVTNDLVEGNLQTTGTISLTNPSGFEKNVSLNVKSGMIYGDGGLLSNVGKPGSIVNNKLQNNSITINNNNDQVKLSSATIALGDTVYLNVSNLVTSVNDTSTANIASANVVNATHSIATYANTVAVATQIRANSISDTVNAAYVLANTVNASAISALQEIANNYSIDAAIYRTANSAYDKANSANLLAYNISLGSNAYASGIGASANLYSASVGVAANLYADSVGTSANLYAAAVGVAANSYAAVAFAKANSALPNVAGQSGVTLTGNLSVTGTYADQYGKLRLQFSSTPVSTARVLAKNDIANLVVMGTNTSSTQSNTYIPENVFTAGDIIRLYNPTSTAQTINPNVMFVSIILSNSATANSMTGASRNVNANGIVTLYCIADNKFVLDGWAATSNKMAAYTELFIDQGSTFNTIITLNDDTTTAPINLEGYTVRSQMRRSYYSVNPSATFTCTISDSANGEITLSLTDSQTSSIKAGRYLFDVETEDSNDTVTRVLEGIITVTPGVTR